MSEIKSSLLETEVVLPGSQEVSSDKAARIATEALLATGLVAEQDLDSIQGPRELAACQYEHFGGFGFGVGDHDVFVSNQNKWLPKGYFDSLYPPNQLVLSEENDWSGLRGLLWQAHGVFDLPSKLRREVRVYPSPEYFNNLMRRLGRTPGKDCFKLVRNPGGVVGPINYIAFLSQKKVPAASDVAYYFTHDRDIEDHVQAWWTLPSIFVDLIQERASYLRNKRTSGEVVDPQTTDEEGTFVAAIDSFSVFTNKIVRLMSDLPSADPDEQAENDANFKCELQSMERSNWCLINLDRANITGVPQPGETQKFSYNQAVKQVVINIADIFLRLDSIQRPDGDDENELAARQEYYAKLQQWARGEECVVSAPVA